MTTPSKRICNLLAKALDMERKGKAYYDRMARRCKNKQCRDIFKMLSGHEDVHTERIQKIYDSLSAGGEWCEWEEPGKKHPELGQVFRAMAKKYGADVTANMSDIQALGLGVDFEAASVKFYRDNLKKAEDKAQKEFFKKMILEEREHHSALSDMKLYLENPSAWFQEKERSGLDGA